MPALNSTSTCLRGLRNVPNFLNSQSNDHDQLVTLECLIIARLCIEATHFAIAESVNQSISRPSLFLFHSFIKFNIGLSRSIRACYHYVARDWVFGALFCRMTSFMTHLSIVASVLTMAAIAMERWCPSQQSISNQPN